MSISSEHFDQRSKEWDLDLAKVERAKTVAKLIMERITIGQYKIAMEYGCGTGLLSQALASQFEKFILADTSEGMLEVVAEKISQLGLNHFFPIKLDLIEEPTYPQASVDVIFSLLTLHHINETEKIVLHFANTIKPGGKLFLADLDQEDGTFHPAGTPGIHFGFDRDALTEIVMKAGLENIQFVDAFVIHKENFGKPRDYPVFLMEATKPSKSDN